MISSPRPRPITARLASALVAASTIAVLPVTDIAASSPDCPSAIEYDELDHMTLHQALGESTEIEPGYGATQSDLEAAEVERDQIDRQWLPQPEISSQGDIGKRVSPGAERDQGVSARASIHSSLSLLLYDSGRHWQRRLRDLQIDEAQATQEVFDVDFRTDVARAYVEAYTARSRREVLERERAFLDELADVVDRRVEAGVESDYQARVLEESRARARRLAGDAADEFEAAVIELSGYVDRCIAPDELATDVGAIADIDAPESPPEVRQLRRRAASADADADATEAQGRFEFRAIGTGGLYFSPAYDNVPEPEYFSGVSGLWRPDLSGTRGLQADAQSQRAEALQQEADSLERQAQRRLDALTRRAEQLDDRRAALERQRDHTQQRAAAATARWEQGVEQWTEVVDARERLEEVRLDEIDLYAEEAQVIIEWTQLTGETERLSGWLNNDDGDS